MATETATETKSSNGSKTAASGKELARNTPAAGEIIAKAESGASNAALLKGLGIAPSDLEGLEQVQSGGVQKWLNLKAFQENPNAAQNQGVKGTGKAFAGVLLARQEIPDDENGEPNADGVNVRHFYTIKLLAECPVTVKNEDGSTLEEVAQPGDIIAVGERHALRAMKEMTEDGGAYIVVIRPHSRIKIGGGRTMWTFDMFKKVVRPPQRVRAELVTKSHASSPF